MRKLCPTFTSHVVDDKMEYTYITSLLWFATRYTHIICIKLKVCLQAFKCYIIYAHLIKECPQNLKDVSNIDATSRQRQNRKYIYIKPSYLYIGLRFLKEKP